MAAVIAAHGGLIALLSSFGPPPLPPHLTTQGVRLIAPASPAAQVAAADPTPRPPQRRQPSSAPSAAAQPRRAAASSALASQSARPEEHGPSAAADAVSAGAVSAAAMSGSPAASSGSASVAVSPARLDANYLSNPAPAYPSLSRKMGEEGKVMLRVLVDASGRATRIEINSSSAWPRLDQAAQDAVSRWKFVPARRGDEAVDAWVLVPIVFNLRN